jgi:hypothetical protein
MKKAVKLYRSEVDSHFSTNASITKEQADKILERAYLSMTMGLNGFVFASKNDDVIETWERLLNLLESSEQVTIGGLYIALHQAYDNMYEYERLKGKVDVSKGRKLNDYFDKKTLSYLNKKMKKGVAKNE